MVKVWQIALATLLIYAAGVFTGGMLVKVTNSAPMPTSAAPQTAETKAPESRGEQRNRREGERRNPFMDHFAKELELSSEQRAEVERIFKEGQDRIRNRIDPITKEEFERTHQGLLKVLTPEQQAKAEDFRKRMRDGGHDRDKDRKKKSADNNDSKPEACAKPASPELFLSQLVYSDQSIFCSAGLPRRCSSLQ